MEFLISIKNALCDPNRFKMTKAGIKTLGTWSVGLLGSALKVIVLLAIVLFAFKFALGGNGPQSSFQMSNVNESLAALKISNGDSKDIIQPDKDAATIYIIRFNGDTMVTNLDSFTQEIEFVLANARPEKDECWVLLDSPGGAVTRYGKASTQLARLKQNNIFTTAFVSDYAASGGYMMAAVCNKIVAEPYALVGSIGVVAGMFNFSGILNQHGVEYIVLTAGKFKRTLTQFTPATPEAVEKYKEQLTAIHNQFMAHVKNNRPENFKVTHDGKEVITQFDINKVATGEAWTAQESVDLELGLVNELGSYEVYRREMVKTHNLRIVKYIEPTSAKSSFLNVWKGMVGTVLDEIEARETNPYRIIR